MRPINIAVPALLSILSGCSHAPVSGSGDSVAAAASPGGVLGLFAETDVSPHPDQWGPRGARAAYLEAKKSVSELSDDTVLATISGLLAR